MAATSQGLVASMPFCCTSMGGKSSPADDGKMASVSLRKLHLPGAGQILPHANSPSLFPALQTGGQLGRTKIKIPLAGEIPKSQTGIVLPIPRWGGPAAGSPKGRGLQGSRGAPGRCTKRLPPLLPGSLGRSGHNSAAPCAQPALKPLQRPCSGRRRVGRSGCTPNLGFQTAGLLGPRLQGPEAGTRQGERNGGSR